MRGSAAFLLPRLPENDAAELAESGGLVTHLTSLVLVDDASLAQEGLATPEPIRDWSLTSLKEKLIKIGAKIISHGRYVAFQMAEVAIPRHLFVGILRLIAGLRPPHDQVPTSADRL